jgi:predicted GNAT family acetyltransferase
MLARTMRVTHHASSAALLAHAGAFLELAEAENGLILGICAAWAPRTAEPCLWASVDDATGPIAVAIRTPPFNVVLSRTTEAGAHAIADDLAARDTKLPGVTSIAETARAFADRWSRARSVRAEVTMRQGIYELTRVVPPSSHAAGALRAPRADEVDLLAAWTRGFGKDSGLPAAEHNAFASRVAAFIADGALFVWDVAGAPVSMAALQGKTRHGVRVSLVYTPTDLRGRGYASACVAAVSARALASGCRFCTLYTDLANPTSNAIYQRVGYARIGDSEMIAFV